MNLFFYCARILLGLLLMLPLCVLAPGCRQDQKTAPKAARPAPVVSFLPLETQETVLSTRLPGRTSAFRKVMIRPQVNGLVKARLFEEGSNVKAGQILYQIDPAPFKAAAESAQARLEAARKAADRLTAAMDMSHAGIARQKAALEMARINADRVEQLARTNSISAVQKDQTITELKIAQAALKTAQAKLESDRKAQEASRADIKQANAALKIAEINLRYCRVTAPISGWIGKSSVTEGAVVTAYQPTPLATIQQLDPIYVEVPQSSAQLLRLKRSLSLGNIRKDEKHSDAVQLVLEDGTAYPHPGTLQFSDVTVEASTGSVILRIVVPNPEGLLLPGMFVRATIREGVDDQAIMIPQQGVSRDHKGNPFAMVVNSEDMVEFRPLVLDRAMGNQWRVSRGLSAGDRLIVEGLQMLRPGTKVTAKPFVSHEKEGS